jgi:hypothetical protein
MSYKIHTSSFRGITYFRTKLPPPFLLSQHLDFTFFLYKRINIWLHTIVLLPSSAKGRKKNTRWSLVMQSVVGANLSSEASIMGIKGFVSVHGKNYSRLFSIPLFGYSAIRRSPNIRIQHLWSGGGGGRYVTYTYA